MKSNLKKTYRIKLTLKDPDFKDEEEGSGNEGSSLRYSKMRTKEQQELLYSEHLARLAKEQREREETHNHNNANKN